MVGGLICSPNPWVDFRKQQEKSSSLKNSPIISRRRCSVLREGDSFFSTRTGPGVLDQIVHPRSYRTWFMKDLIGIEKAEDILREHVRKNLFVQSFMMRRKAGYSIPSYFRDFLKAKSKERVGKEEHHSLLLKAGILYEQRNELENAVKYFLEAKEYSHAVQSLSNWEWNCWAKKEKAIYPSGSPPSLMKSSRRIHGSFFIRASFNPIPWGLKWCGLWRRLMNCLNRRRR